jgi:uncharacterized membrane protein
MRVLQFIFPLAVILTGLLAGIHFGNIIGYLPALGEVEADHIVPFWKKVDEYFSRRMPVFGIVLLISLSIVILLMRKETSSTFFWLVLAGLVLIIVDVVISIKVNNPANDILRAWQGGALPESFESIRAQMLAAFYGRAIASILSFILVMLGYMSWQSKLY